MKLGLLDLRGCTRTVKENAFHNFFFANDNPVNKVQFIIANVLAGCFVFLMVIQFLLSRVNQELNRNVVAMQQQVTVSQQARPILNQLAIRFSPGSR